MNPSFNRIRILCSAVFVLGIAGIIVTSIVSNNNGLIITIGLVTSIAAIALLTASTTATPKRIDAFDDAAAERLEQRVVELISSGVDEAALRSTIKSAIDLGRSVS